MKSWQEEQFHALQSIRCERELFEAARRMALEMEFEHCSYGIRMPLPLSDPRIAMFNNHPLEWRARYLKNGYLDVDPTVQHGLRSSTPFTWSDETAGPASDFWDEARAFGLRFGWSQSCRDPSGICGLLVLSRSADPLSEAELAEKEARMMRLTQFIHGGMARLLTPKLMPEAETRLSGREVDVIRWTAEGKTSADIGEILRISERTVNFHIGNAVQKLNAANKTAAAIKAALLGLL